MVLDLSKPLKAYFTDDDLDDYETYCEAVLRVSKNIELVCFSNCDHLLAALEKDNPHILFVDINLGKTTGIECLRMIKTLNQLRTVPTVIMSTSASRFQLDEYKQLGCHYYFQKPGSFTEIINEMQRIFERDWECS